MCFSGYSLLIHLVTYHGMCYLRAMLLRGAEWPAFPGCCLVAGDCAPVYCATCARPQPAKAAVLSLEELDTKATYVNECYIGTRVLA